MNIFDWIGIGLLIIGALGFTFSVIYAIRKTVKALAENPTAE